jgi:transposase InsO family protein
MVTQRAGCRAAEPGVGEAGQGSDGEAGEMPDEGMDITYIPMARGFVYLAAVLDWFSRRVLAWRVSISLEVDFCLEAVDEALARHGRRRSSIPTKAVSSPARHSSDCCRTTRSGSA